MMKHASNEKKHVPYLNGNPTRTVAISKVAALQDISVGISINYDNREIRHYFNGDIASFYQQHFINSCYRVGIWARESRRTHL